MSTVNKEEEEPNSLHDRTRKRLAEALTDGNFERTLNRLTDVKTPRTNPGESPLELVDPDEFFYDATLLTDQQVSKLINHIVRDETNMGRSQKRRIFNWLANHDRDVLRAKHIKQYLGTDRRDWTIKNLVQPFFEQQDDTSRQTLIDLVQIIVADTDKLYNHYYRPIRLYMIENYSFGQVIEVLNEREYDLDINDYTQFIKDAVDKREYEFAKAALQQAPESVEQTIMISNIDQTRHVDDSLGEIWRHLFEAHTQDIQDREIKKVAENNSYALRALDPVLDKEERVLAASTIMMAFDRKPNVNLRDLDAIATNGQKRQAIRAATSEEIFEPTKYRVLLGEIDTDHQWEEAFIEKLFDRFAGGERAFHPRHSPDCILNNLDDAGHLSLSDHAETIKEQAEKHNFDRVVSWIDTATSDK